MAIPSADFKEFLKSARFAGELPDAVGTGGVLSARVIPERTDVNELSIELLGIRRDLVDAEHAVIAAEKTLSRIASATSGAGTPGDDSGRASWFAVGRLVGCGRLG